MSLIAFVVDSLRTPFKDAVEYSNLLGIGLLWAQSPSVFGLELGLDLAHYGCNVIVEVDGNPTSTFRSGKI